MSLCHQVQGTATAYVPGDSGPLGGSIQLMCLLRCHGLQHVYHPSDCYEAIYGPEMTRANAWPASKNRLPCKQ